MSLEAIINGIQYDVGNYEPYKAIGDPKRIMARIGGVSIIDECYKKYFLKKHPDRVGKSVSEPFDGFELHVDGCICYDY